MKKTPSDPADTGALRSRAEEKLQGKQKGRRKEISTRGEQLEAQRLVHELQVHQIELEMQNDELRRALSEIEESRARYLNLYDFSPIGYFTFDRKGRIEAVNLTGASLLGMERQSLIKAPFPGFLHQDSLPVFSSHMEQVFTSGVKQTCELWLMLKNKNLLPVIMESILTEPAEVRPLQAHSAMIDISKRKQAEKQVFESQQRLYALMQAVPVGVSFSDDTTCQRITGNLAVLEQFEVSQEDNLSPSAPENNASVRHVRFFRDGRQLSAAELPLQRAITENKAIPPMELEVKLPSGRSWLTEASGAPVHDAQGNVIAGITVTVDITERKQMEDALHQSHDNLENQVQERTRELEEAIEKQRVLAAELLMTEVRERRRIAVDLHDNICQSLAVAKLRLHDLQARVTEIDLEKPLIEIKDIISDAIYHTRSLLKDISSSALHELGLSAALDSLAKQINDKYGLAVILESPQSIGKIDEEVQVLLYQAVRELLLNIIKHAKVSAAAVSIQEIGSNIRVQVKDDGVGFDVSDLQTMFNQSGGFGLFNIRERLKLWDGYMEINSGQGMGTCITISVPRNKQSQQ